RKLQPERRERERRRGDPCAKSPGKRSVNRNSRESKPSSLTSRVSLPRGIQNKAGMLIIESGGRKREWLSLALQKQCETESEPRTRRFGFLRRKAGFRAHFVSDVGCRVPLESVLRLLFSPAAGLVVSAHFHRE